MFRHILVFALLAGPGPVLARPTKTLPKVEKVAAIPAVPQCTHVRKKSFRQAEGWSVKTVSLACKTVTAAASRPGNKSFTSLRSNKDNRSK